MRVQYKKISIPVSHCGDCGERLLGNNSIVQPYRCSCGVWQSKSFEEPFEFVLAGRDLPCACMLNGKKNPEFNYHSEFDCHNSEKGVLKA